MSTQIICGNLDLSKMDSSSIISSDQYAWVGISVDQKLRLINPPLMIGGEGDRPFLDGYGTTGMQFINKSVLVTDDLEPYALITLSSPAYASLCNVHLNYPRQLLNASANFTSAGAVDPNAPQTNPQPIDIFPAGNIDQTNVLNTALNSIDLSSLNLMGFQPPAVKPLAATVAIRDANNTYGPWASANFFSGEGSYGGIEIQHVPDLNPWAYKSLAGMSAAAQAMLAGSFVGLTRAETGSITIQGLPTYSQLGSALENGPNLTDMSTTFGKDGISTTYSFKSFTPKFGKLGNMWIEKFKEAQKKRSEFARILKKQTISQYKTAQRANNIRRVAQIQAATGGAIARQASSHRVLVGNIHNMWADPVDSTKKIQFQRSMVGTETMAKTINETTFGYNEKAFMSLEGIFGPVSISGGGSELIPRFAIPSGVGSSGTLQKLHATIPAQPPFSTGNILVVATGVDEYNINLFQNHLNPLSNPDSLIELHDGSHYGHSIDVVGRGSGLGDQGGINQCLYGRDEHDYRYSDDYRFLGLRGPLVLHSWGYDTDGKPIPNEADLEDSAYSGIFTSENLKDKFLNNWLQKPSTWPAAPIDLRFDRERGVWVSPPPYKISVAEVKTTVPAYGRGSGVLINRYEEDEYAQPVYDKDGNLVATSGSSSEANIIIEDRLGIDTDVGTKRYAYFDNFTSTYLLLGGGGGAAPPIRLGQFNGPWPNEPGYNIKLVKLFVQPDNPSGPSDWIPELENGQIKTVVTLNFLSYIPSKAGSDRNLWCTVVPISNKSGVYEYSIGEQTFTKNYDKLWMLLGAEC